MKKNTLRKTLIIMLFVGTLWILPSIVNAAYISITPSKTTANPGEKVNVTISSDCTGRVNLSASNGNLSSNKVWLEGGSQSITITVGNTGSATITATPQDGMMSNNGVDVKVTTASKNITISSGTSNTNSSPSNTNNSNSGTSSTKPTSPTTTTPVAKSSVATLSNLGITPNDFSGFSASKTTYSTEVPNDIESVEIYAKKGQSGQTISGTGKKTLKEGTNTFSIVVTAEDGKTKKTYTLNITRKAKEENTTSEENQTTETNEISPEETEDPTAQAFGLTELTISGIELKPQFKTDVYEYTVDLKSDLNILDIKALATEEKANIEITGNENLQDGENIITITVKGDGEDKNATYKIIVNKEITQEKEKTLSNNKETLTYIIIIVAVVAIILIVLIALIIKKIKNKDTLSIPYQDINDNEEDNIEENSLEENNEQIDETEDIEEIKPKKKSSKGKRFK